MLVYLVQLFLCLQTNLILCIRMESFLKPIRQFSSSGLSETARTLAHGRNNIDPSISRSCAAARKWSAFSWPSNAVSTRRISQISSRSSASLYATSTWQNDAFCLGRMHSTDARRFLGSRYKMGIKYKVPVEPWLFNAANYLAQLRNYRCVNARYPKWTREFA